MSVPIEFHSTLCRTYHTLYISDRQPITEVKAKWNVAADVWEIAFSPELVMFSDFEFLTSLGTSDDFKNSFTLLYF